jgi:alpha-tubulin suppressor-like RCC1 family protein
VITQVDGGTLHSAALASDGTVWTWGDNFAGQLGDGMILTQRPTPAQVAGLTHVRHITAGFDNTLAVRDVT